MAYEDNFLAGLLHLQVQLNCPSIKDSHPYREQVDKLGCHLQKSLAVEVSNVVIPLILERKA